MKPVLQSLKTGAHLNLMQIAPIIEILIHLWVWARGVGEHGIPMTMYTI